MYIDPVMKSPLRGPLKWVMVAVVWRAYEQDGQAHLTVTSLAEEAGVSKRTAQETTKKLEDMGLLSVSRSWGRGGYNIYEPNLAALERLKDAPDAPLPTPKDAETAPLPEKNLSYQKGAKSVTKDAENELKDAKCAQKGAGGAPNKKINKIKNKNRAREGAREGTLPPRTSPNGLAAQKRKKEPAVNRAEGSGGVMPQFHETTSTEARAIWSNCLQGKTADFCLPQTARLGPIEGGKAMIFDLTGFERDRLEQSGQSYRLAEQVSKLVGEKTLLALARN
ncbi:helix-turn-helix domain-containing protein [Kordiimonas sp.]|uniref:helix-turn-helix domain-containing protein n=1 Tax=Kordiimonas sp. TaxID=1970157 RepID=UPI003A8FAE46